MNGPRCVPVCLKVSEETWTALVSLGGKHGESADQVIVNVLDDLAAEYREEIKNHD